MNRRTLAALSAMLVVGNSPASGAEPVEAPTPSAHSASDVQDLLFFGQNAPVVFRLHIRLDGTGFRTAWNERLDRFFAQIDADKDGVLNVQEAQRIDRQSIVPEKSFFEKLFTLNREKIPNLPADTSPRDGKVTRDELAAYFRRTRRGPFAVQTDSGGRRVTGAQAAGEKLLSTLDSDNSKEFSPAELARGSALLREYDVNDDESVTLNELNAGRNRYLYSSGGSRSRRQAIFAPVGPAANQDRLVSRLLETYDDDTDRQDKPKQPRTLTRRELGWQAEYFDRCDEDADGTLNEKELRKFLNEPLPVVELLIRRGKLPRDGRAARSAGRRLNVLKVEKSASKLSVRRLDKHVVEFDFGRDRVLFATDPSGDSAGSAAKAVYETQFNFADTDNNEYLEPKEVRRNFYFMNAFKLMDADGDGKLFKKEVTAWLDRLSKAARSRSVMNVTDRGSNLFELLDADSDRQLGLRETRTLSERIRHFDRSGDGAVKLDELPRQYRVLVTQGRPDIQGVPVSVPDVPALSANRRRSRSGPRWFHKMDVNADGDVSSREFLGPRAHFRRLDADNDGLIAPEEALRFD